MMLRLHKRGAALLAVILAVVGLGFITPALGTEEGGTTGRSAALETPVAQAMLTKVVDGPANFNIGGDSYTFSFTQKLQTSQNGNEVLVDLDANSDEKAPIAPYTINNESNTILTLNTSNSTGNSRGDASHAQTAIQVPLSSILGSVTFPHAGIFIYEVKESSTSCSTPGVNISQSAATYIMRVYVKNESSTGSGDSTSTTTQVADIVTIEKTYDEDGNPLTTPTKVDPTYPQVSTAGVYSQITQETANKPITGNELAGGERGRDVYGFTFANEYVGGGPVTISKSITGKYANKKQKFPVTITIKDNVAPAGSCISYNVDGGTDTTNNGHPTKLTEVDSNDTDFMVVFDSSKTVTISAELADGDTINITGLYGWYNASETYENVPGTMDHRKKFTDGLKQGTSCTVVESDFGDYAASAVVEYKESTTSETKTDTVTNYDNASFNFSPTIGAEGSTIVITNNLADEYPDRTGIIINNLPYVLMVGVPLVVFALLFVAKRRSRTDA
ncbi:MAG: hypothetical protein Q4A01_04000 [Coriobacteriales bacterium]|nr:hypothetical protein [Coriobacteriales bacterium]